MDPPSKMEHELAEDNGKICITEQQYLEFLKFHREDPNRKFLRTGQAFCNYFKLTNADLFYAIDEGKIITLITQYIDHNAFYNAHRRE